MVTLSSSVHAESVSSTGAGLEPQSTGFFLLLMGAFCALLGCVAVARQVAVRVLAAALAFVPAMLFGVAAVNKYYGYYQTWGSAAADLTATGITSAPQLPLDDSRQQLARILGRVTVGAAAAREGETVRLMVHGRLSHLDRTVYLYLPPQYFQARYARARFPAIELITGFPGEPQDWINVVGITQSYLTLLNDGAVRPAVLVMPDANGGPRVSLQCLNVWHGPQDATFLAVDLPGALARALRVAPSGPAWGVAGYSEGGYCAANLALLYPSRFGSAGVLSGYFVPGDDQFGNPVRTVNPFGPDAALRALNTPRAAGRRAAGQRAHSPVLARRGRRLPRGRVRRPRLPAAAVVPAAGRVGARSAGRQAQHGDLAGPGPAAAGMDDAPPRVRRAAPGDGGGTCRRAVAAPVRDPAPRSFRFAQIKEHEPVARPAGRTVPGRRLRALAAAAGRAGPAGPDVSRPVRRSPRRPRPRRRGPGPGRGPRCWRRAGG